MRTAYFCEPKTCTCATPDTIEIRCANIDSPYSSSCDIGICDDVSAKYTIAPAAGFTFWYDGGMIPGGKLRSVWAIAACTSWAAASISRSSANWSVIEVDPRLLVDEQP